MAQTQFIYEATADNFARLVLENSDKGPVLVNYWSPQAGPCMMLRPRLLKLAGEYAGRFLLVTLNTDMFGMLAREHGVTSIPTTKVFRRGKIIDTLHGAESEASLRQFIDRHIEHASDTRHVAALRAYEQGDIDRAIREAAEAAMDNPDEPRIVLDLVKLLIVQKRYGQAESLLAALPDALRTHADIAALQAHVELIQAAQTNLTLEALAGKVNDATEDLEARFLLAAKALILDDYNTAMAQLLRIVQSDRAFRQDIGRRGLVALFGVLGESDSRTRHYRRELTTLLSKTS
jgi:putative thioredoxin